MQKADTSHTDSTLSLANTVLTHYTSSNLRIYCINVKKISDSINSAIVSEGSVFSCWGILEGELGVKDNLQIF